MFVLRFSASLGTFGSAKVPSCSRAWKPGLLVIFAQESDLQEKWLGNALDELKVPGEKVF